LEIMNVGNKALVRAALTSDLELLEIAIAAGVDIRAIKEKHILYDTPTTPDVEVGTAALQYAIRSIRSGKDVEIKLQILRRLLDIGVKIDSFAMAEACYSGNDALIRLFIERGAPLANSLYNASVKGIAWLVRLILEEKSLDTLTKEEKSRRLLQAILEAGQKGHKEVFEILLEVCDINNASEVIFFRCNNSALLEASTKGRQEVIELLLELGASGPLPLGDVGLKDLVNTSGSKIRLYDDRWMAIPVGVQNKLADLSVVFFRGESGVYASDYSNPVLISFAALHGHDALARKLVSLGADLRQSDTNGRTVLMSAARGGVVWLIALCIQAGENIDVKDGEGYTPLMEAARNGHFEAVKFLVNIGANINHTSDYNGETVLHSAIFGKNQKTIQWLIEQGADLAAEMNDLTTGIVTPLMSAAASGQAKVVEMLIKAGADVNQRDSEDGCTALHYATYCDDSKALEILMQYGAEVDALSFEETAPLFSATAKENTNALVRLLDAGAEIDRNSTYGTALHQAATWGRDESVRVLLNAGADRDITDRNGKTALQLAEEEGHLRIIEYLKGIRPTS
jgi:ankyrin repeat protein